MDGKPDVKEKKREKQNTCMIFSKKQMADAMRMRKTSGFILFFLVIIISGLLNGCTSLYKIDLAAGRQKNLNEDSYNFV